jgi:hypothetical protein
MKRIANSVSCAGRGHLYSKAKRVLVTLVRLPNRLYTRYEQARLARRRKDIPQHDPRHDSMTCTQCHMHLPLLLQLY